MSIPLYFAASCKESVTFSAAKALPFGCGMTKAGDFRMPENFWSGVPLLLDDAVPALPNSKSLQKLKELCSHGCILDFERPVSNFHLALIRKLSDMKIAPLWLPERFSIYEPKAVTIISHNLPHNSWIQFCTGLQARYPNRWALELQPLNCTKKLPQIQKSRVIYLESAVCQCKIEADSITYYDTQQTLLKKLHIAEKYGCQGAIALWSEWPQK